MTKKFFEAVTVGLRKSLTPNREGCAFICLFASALFYAFIFCTLAKVWPGIKSSFPIFAIFDMLLSVYTTFFLLHCYDAVKYASEHPKDTMAEAWEATKTDDYGDEF